MLIKNYNTNEKNFPDGVIGSNNLFLWAEKGNDAINAKEAKRVISTLASDDMLGRKAFTPDIDKAADFFAVEFKAAGLQIWNNSGTHRQEFALVRPRFISASATFDGAGIEQKIKDKSFLMIYLF